MNTQRQAPRRAPDSLLHRQLDRALTAQRPVAIAVVLSGAGSDGASGLARVDMGPQFPEKGLGSC